ncbi:hypothetical protein RKE29_09135 [Streptomyces sp. B1866]|uniref:hypothetical protein n=1 Tax=Streptomyces sp. B1866 TaxID=3075431 RepID=UPI00288E857F|nr:hypothetical protein [Streptomyces sp. B1866]MDT3396803.1 hypothetical protein [Streptomyces sp. B1866]
MSRFEELLGTDFDGRPTTDLDDVVYEGLDDSRHRERVPGLVALMNDESAAERERFLACVALTTWAEPAGYDAVVRAAADPKRAPWYDILIDRKFSVDNTFAQLSLAVSDSDVLAEEKGTLDQRVEAFRSLVRIADSEYFDEKLGDLLDARSVAAVLPDIRAVVGRGVAALAAREPSSFDLATQLVDLAAAVATVDGPTAVGLATDVLGSAASQRALIHAVAIVHRSRSPECRRFGEYLSTIGDDEVRAQVAAAQARREDGGRPS